MNELDVSSNFAKEVAKLRNYLSTRLRKAVRSAALGARSHFAYGLHRMLGQVARERGTPSFGTCASCEHLEGDGCCPDGQAFYSCGFASEPLLLEELDDLCINFVLGKPMAATGAVTGAAPR